MKKTTKKCAAGLMCLSMAAMNLLAPSAKLLTANINASATESPIRFFSIKKASIPASATHIDIGEQEIRDGLIKIQISKSGNYVLTGSNYINEAYVDVQIVVENGVEADIWIDDLNIKNDDAEFKSSATSSAFVQEVVPWVINGIANIHIQSDSEITSYTRAEVNGELNFVESADSATLNMNREKAFSVYGSLFSGTGNVSISDVYSLNFGDTSTDFLYTNMPIRIFSGNVSFGVSANPSNYLYTQMQIDGGKVSGLTEIPSLNVTDSSNESVFEREFSGLPESTEIVSINSNLQSYMYTDADGKLSNIWLKKEDVTFFTEEMAYSYTYVSETDSYTGPNISATCTVSFVDKDTNEVIFKQYTLPGGTVNLPESEKYDYAFAVGDNEFTATTPVNESIIVTVTKTIKRFSLNIDGVETIVDYGTKVPNGVFSDNDSDKLFYGGAEVTRDLNLTSLGLDSIEIDGVQYAAIGTADELDTFSDLVNNEHRVTLNGALTADIVANADFNPIGYAKLMSYYSGKFNGNGHSVTLNIVRNDEDLIGFFGGIGGGAKISNLVTKGSVSGNYAVGGIAGGSYGAGIITIENCMNYASISAKDTDASGIIGTNFESEATLVIINCANIGNITGTDYSCAICSWTGYNATIKNCYNYGTIDSTNTDNEDIEFIRGINMNLDNCYILQNPKNGVIQASAEQFASGEIAFRLNEKLPKNGSPWMQTIGTDAYPILFGNPETQSVYYSYPDCDSTEKTYVNVQHDEQGHSYDSVVTPPTCTEPGYTTHTCKYCDDTFTDTPTEKLEHTYGEWTHIDGTKTHSRTCLECSAVETDDCVFSDVVTPPTCTEAGYTTHTCDTCGYSFTDTPTETVEHTYGAWHFGEGGLIRECEDCGEVQSFFAWLLDAILPILRSIFGGVIC